MFIAEENGGREPWPAEYRAWSGFRDDRVSVGGGLYGGLLPVVRCGCNLANDSEHGADHRHDVCAISHAHAARYCRHRINGWHGSGRERADLLEIKEELKGCTSAGRNQCWV